MPTLLEIAKINGSDALAGLLDEAARPVPEISGSYRGVSIPLLGEARTIKGLQYKTLVRTALPTVGFRKANAGVGASKSTYENRLVETFILNPRWQCDVAVADAHEDGAEAYITLEAKALTQAALQAAARQFYYGRNTNGDAAGHPGLIDAVQAGLTIDATGSTADTGSSVYAVKFGLDHVCWVNGKEGDWAMPEEVRIADVSDPDDATKKFSAYVSEIVAHIGVQVNSLYSVARIKNLTEQAGKGLTDNLLADLLDTFPEGFEPDVILMTKRSRKQLKKSRTATNPTGAPAPTPVDYEGIPIVTTAGLVNTEAIA